MLAFQISLKFLKMKPSIKCKERANLLVKVLEIWTTKITSQQPVRFKLPFSNPHFSNKFEFNRQFKVVANADGF